MACLLHRVSLVYLRNRFLHGFLLFGLMVVYGVGLSLAAVDGDLEQIFEMTFDELLDLEIVTSSKQLESLLQTPSAVDVLTGEEFVF